MGSEKEREGKKEGESEMGGSGEEGIRETGWRD